MRELSTYGILKVFIKDIFPMVECELKRWRNLAELCPDKILSGQAISSLTRKSFHAQGGSVFALYPGADKELMVKLIVAYQTISDYLDNLCDRAGVEDEKAFSTLHLAVTEALDPSSPLSDYYKYYPYHNDGSYLLNLVKECRIIISGLPSYNCVKNCALEFADLYSRLQVYKHMNNKIRESKLFAWSKIYSNIYPYLFPQEFWAATGSTLGIFMLFAASFNPCLKDDDIIKIKKAYFPWVCGLHILLDYFIDINEDIENNDLNFIRYYKDSMEMSERLKLFIESALQSVSLLSFPNFHNTMVLGLLAMYLSDYKAYDDNIRPTALYILNSQGIKLKLMHGLCKILRKKGII